MKEICSQITKTLMKYINFKLFDEENPSQNDATFTTKKVMECSNAFYIHKLMSWISNNPYLLFKTLKSSQSEPSCPHSLSPLLSVCVYVYKFRVLPSLNYAKCYLYLKSYVCYVSLRWYSVTTPLTLSKRRILLLLFITYCVYTL